MRCHPDTFATRVCIVASHPLVSQYLLGLLERAPGLRTVILDAPARLNSADDSCVFLIDNNTLPLPLSECLGKLKTICDRGRFVVLDAQLMETERMLRLGIHGFLLYSELSQTLVSAIRTVASGNTWICPQQFQDYVRRTCNTNDKDLFHQRLTMRESEIVDFLKRRMSNHEIAGLLGIRESTVKFHVSNLLSKLHATDRRDLLRKQQAVDIWNKLLRYSSMSRP